MRTYVFARENRKSKNMKSPIQMRQWNRQLSLYFHSSKAPIMAEQNKENVDTIHQQVTKVIGKKDALGRRRNRRSESPFRKQVTLALPNNARFLLQKATNLPADCLFLSLKVCPLSTGPEASLPPATVHLLSTMPRIMYLLLLNTLLPSLQTCIHP